MSYRPEIPPKAALEVVAEQVAYPKPPDPLAELRAEVERLRGESRAARDNLSASHDYDDYPQEEYWRGRADAFHIVLDLIDKREGQ